MAMITMTQAEREIIDLLSHHPTAQEIVAFHPSEEVAERAYELVAIERERDLTDEERRELDTYLYLEHFMGMMKIEANRQLGVKVP